jgi:hypothetical protein
MSDLVCQQCGHKAIDGLSYGRCRNCRRHLAYLFVKILGLGGPTWDEHGVLIDWDEIESLYESMTPIVHMDAKTLFRTLTSYDEARIP